MSEIYSPTGNVSAQNIKRATSGEAATGTHGQEFMRDNITFISDRIRYLKDTGDLASPGPISGRALYDKGGAVVNSMHPDFLAVGNGTTDDRLSLFNANAYLVAAGGGTLLITKTHRVSSALSFDATVTLVFQNGCSLSIDNGITVTVNGTVVALAGPPHTGLGTMTFANANALNWFGNQFGFGFGVKEPSNSDDYFHIEKNYNGPTGTLVYNRTEGATAEVYHHMFAGNGVGADLQFRAQSSAMGGNVNIVAGHGSGGLGTFNLIQSDNKTLNLYANNLKVVEITPTANTVNYIGLKGAATTGGVNISALGSDTNVTLSLNAQGSGSISLRTSAGTATQLLVTHTASATRAVSITGSNGGNPVIDSTSTGALRLSAGTNDVQFGKALVALGGGAAPTLGTIGGSGPAVAAQNTWMRWLDSAGVAFWVPAWK